MHAGIDFLRPLLVVNVWQMGSLGLILAIFILFVGVLYLAPKRSAFCDLPGPESDYNLFWGHLHKIYSSPSGTVHEEWVANYGRTLQFRGWFARRRLFTLDTQAVAHILNDPYNYPRPKHVQNIMRHIFGNSVLSAEGEQHKNYRKLLNPCFGASRVRDMFPIFTEKASKLRDILVDQLNEKGGSQCLDLLPWLNRVSLDIIGVAGFDYDFNTLDQSSSDVLATAFESCFSANSSFTPFAWLRAQLPFLNFARDERTRRLEAGRKVFHKMGEDIVAGKRAIVEKSGSGRDLLSSLIQANSAEDIPPSRRLSDEDLLGQIATFITAGHETTSATVAWILHELSLPANASVQSKLRQEINSISPNPTLTELESLPYLDAVLREGIRLHPAISFSYRTAARDDIIPLRTPVLDRRGVLCHHVKIKKGDEVWLSYMAMNRDEQVWGEDSRLFRPERWLSAEKCLANDKVGSFCGTMSFGGGPRNCIGWRLAVAEAKVVIFTLLRSFTFSQPPGSTSIVTDKGQTIVLRPLVVSSDGELEVSLPLRLDHV